MKNVNIAQAIIMAFMAILVALGIIYIPHIAQYFSHDPDKFLAKDYFQPSSQVGLALGGITAFVALIFTGMKTLENQWSQEFRKLYDEFWQNDRAQMARDMISYDDHYNNVLKPALIEVLDKKRGIHPTASQGEFKNITNIKEGNLRNPSQNSKCIECIDIFFSKLVQVGFMPSGFIFKKNKKIRRIFLEYWIESISNRDELVVYMYQEWKSFEEFIEPIRGVAFPKLPPYPR